RQVGVVFQPLGQGDSQACLVRSTFRSWDGVAVGVDLRIAAIPRNGPFEGAVPPGLLGPSGEDLAGNGEILAERGRQIVLEAAGEMEVRLLGNVTAWRHHAVIAEPANFYAIEQIGFQARNSIYAARVKFRVHSEDLRIRMKANAVSAPVVHRTEFLQHALGH